MRRCRERGSPHCSVVVQEVWYWAPCGAVCRTCLAFWREQRRQAAGAAENWIWWFSRKKLTVHRRPHIFSIRLTAAQSASIPTPTRCDCLQVVDRQRQFAEILSKHAAPSGLSAEYSTLPYPSRRSEAQSCSVCPDPRRMLLCRLARIASGVSQPRGRDLQCGH